MKLTFRTAVATALMTAALPATALAERPPTDPVHIEGGNAACQPDYPCSPEPITVEVDKTYPSRLIAWAKEELP